jgi:type I restriction enzyme S subunit
MGLFETRSDAIDPLFGQLRDNPRFAKQRSFIEQRHAQFAPYKDGNFDSAFASACIPRFWEMFLACALLNAGFKLVSRKDLPQGGPDLCIENDNSRIWIEAITVTSGAGPDKIEIPTYEEDGPAHIVPDPQIVLRFCSAIRDKYCNHLGHLAKHIVPPDEPLIIAVNSAGLPVEYWPDSQDLPYAVEAVLPLGEYSVTISKSTRDVIEEGHQFRARIEKLSGSVVPTTSFLDCTFSLISGLLFANVHPLYSTILTSNSFSVLHHFSPLNPLPGRWLGSGEEWTIEKQEGGYYLHRERIAPAT